MPEWNPALLLQSVLFTPLHPLLLDFKASDFPRVDDLNALLAARRPTITVQSGLPLRFVAHQPEKLPFEMQYEPRCYLHGKVQMRSEAWHDLFNALVWMTFPKAKAAINARHYLDLTSASGNPNRRSAVRDTVTLFDESGTVVACADTGLGQLLRDFKWKELFWQRRQQVNASMGFYLFGHGLYQKALQPYIGMTGQGLLVVVEQQFFSWPLARQLGYLDERLAAYLNAPEHCRNTRELAPVPILGVPGWATGNLREDYYDNISYFRSRRQERQQVSEPTSLE